MAKKKALSRRTFLRGAGVAMALPFLDAMRPTWARAATGPEREGAKRFLGFYVPNGIHMPAWTPAAVGADYELSPILSSLAPVKDQLLVLSGLANMPGVPDGPGDHAGGTSAFLTAAHANKSQEDIYLGKSLDQAIAEAVGGETTFSSLEYGCEGGVSTGNCDSGYSCAYVRNISWSSPTTPKPKEVNPKAVFDKLFAGADPGETVEQQQKRRKYKKSILDFVMDDAASLKAKVSVEDRLKLEAYEEGIFELEKQLFAEPITTCAPGVAPLATSDFGDYVNQMSDLMTLAFACDQTRVQTFMLGNGGSERVYNFLGINDGHHYLSHHQSDPEKLAKLQDIGAWEVSRLAYLLERMALTPDGDSNLLDNSVVFFSSEISDGNAHNHDKMPVILAGSAGGSFDPGRHVVYYDKPPWGNLFVSILQAFGVDATEFGDDGMGPLEGLTG